MSAISRFYESAKSLLLNQPQNQENTKIISTPTSPNEYARTNTNYSNVIMSKELDDIVSEARVQPSNSLEIHKKRSRVNSLEENKPLVGLSSKKQKILPLREKNSDILVTPKSRMIKNLQKKKKIESEALDLPNSIGSDSNNNEGSQAHHSIIRTPVNQDGTESHDATPFYTARHYRFGSEDDLEKQLQSSALANTSSIYINSHESDDESEDDSPEIIMAQESKLVAELKIKDINKALVARNSKTQKKKKLKQKLKKKKLNYDKVENELKITSDSNTTDKTVKMKEGEKDLTDFIPNNSTNSIQSSMDKPRLNLLKNSNNSLPDLLPMEYLEDNDETLQATNIRSKSKPPTKLGKKILFNEKQVKDRRVGNTTYRVLKSNSQSLAPRASYDARRIKEMWLQGRNGRIQELNKHSFSKSSYRS
ncbi:putative sporulation protein [Erysiphe necator]|uniref:Putative sporulation protein n=1 Tax=Uncinula necator TaxID=52586 RepID=A0A0B1NX66_UNCNE|nr:putative sporulation protein [Erysiphe necator]